MFDLHVHSDPCLFSRRADDRQTVAEYAAAGFSGCVLKGHFEPTAGRARAAGAGTQMAVYGGIVLNASVGGIAAPAVEDALALGGRVVWMPTIDSRAHGLAGLPRPGGRGAPEYTLAPSLADGSLAAVLRAVADADAVLATGHLADDELPTLIAEARRAGVRRIVATHPTYTVPGLDPAGARALADAGAIIELTAFQLLHQPGAGAAALAAVVREVGAKRCVLSSDAGQPSSPPAPEALGLLVDALRGEGLDRGAVEAMASELPEALVTP